MNTNNATISVHEGRPGPHTSAIHPITRTTIYFEKQTWLWGEGHVVLKTKGFTERFTNSSKILDRIHSTLVISTSRFVFGNNL